MCEPRYAPGKNNNEILRYDVYGYFHTIFGQNNHKLMLCYPFTTPDCDPQEYLTYLVSTEWISDGYNIKTADNF